MSTSDDPLTSGHWETSPYVMRGNKQTYRKDGRLLRVWVKD